ncbi:hypothetical protein IWW36_004727, partial [Coemansia brasiliensis]
MANSRGDESDEYTERVLRKRRRTTIPHASRRSNNEIAQDRPKLRDRRRTQRTSRVSQRASTPELLEILGSSQPPSDNDAADDVYKGESSGDGSALPLVSSTHANSSRIKRTKESSRGRTNGTSSRARANSISSEESGATSEADCDLPVVIETRRTRRRQSSADSKPASRQTTPTQYNLRRRSTNISYKQPEPPQPPSSGYQRFMQMVRGLEREAAEFAAINELEDAISEETFREPAAENVAGADEPETILPDNLAELGRERCRRAGVFNEAVFRGTRGTIPATSFAD